MAIEDIVEEFLLEEGLQEKLQNHRELVARRQEENPFCWLKIPQFHPNESLSYRRIYGPLDEEKFHFFYQGKEYFVEDFSSLNTADCKEIILSFVKKTRSSLLFSLCTQMESLDDRVNTKRLFFHRKRLHHIAGSFLQKIEGYPHLLKKRFKGMKRLGEYLCHRRSSNMIPFIFPRRGDPCYCGSGKKYRKCCGS